MNHQSNHQPISEADIKNLEEQFINALRGITHSNPSFLLNMFQQINSIPAPQPRAVIPDRQPHTPQQTVVSEAVKNKLAEVNSNYAPLVLGRMSKKIYRPISGILSDRVKSYSVEKATKQLQQAERAGVNINELNMGVITGSISGITVVDFDVKSNMFKEFKSGELLFNLIQSMLAVHDQKTFTVKTPSGGYHMYFKYTPKLKTRVGTKYNKQIHAVDIRNDKGYVVGPGYELDNGKYEIIDNCEVIDMPNYVYDLLKFCAQSKFDYPEQSVASSDTLVTDPAVITILDQARPSQ
jgi:hypothetical protein